MIIDWQKYVDRDSAVLQRLPVEEHADYLNWVLQQDAAEIDRLIEEWVYIVAEDQWADDGGQPRS